MPLQVCSGATLHCSLGTIPAVFTATPRPVTSSGRVVGVLTDHLPLRNVPAFGDCRAPGPPGCAPELPTPWRRALPASAGVLVSGVQVLDDGCTLACARGGTVRIGTAGQATHRLG